MSLHHAERDDYTGRRISVVITLRVMITLRTAPGQSIWKGSISRLNSTPDDGRSVGNTERRT